MRLLSKSIHARLMVGAAVGAIALGSGAAWAQTKAPITIPSQDLASALHDFGAQTGHQVMFMPELAKTKVSRGVSAAPNEQIALAQLLEGTGLTFRREANVFVIVQQGEGGSSPQDASGVGGVAEVEALIVTAQKKNESIQDVPIAISAFTMKQLDAQKIEGGFDLLKAIPNVSFSKTNFSGYNFQIRGIGTQAISATTDPAVAVSFNNTTLIVNRLFEQEYLDIERVEVLRGPQGTLYGRNATSGVINVISAKPVIGDFFGEAKLEVGNFNAQRFRGHVNVPLGDEIAVRAAFATTKRDGYGYNEYSELSNPWRPRVEPDVDNRNLWTGRITVGWEPSDRFRANFIYERFEEDDRRTRTSKQLCHRDTGEVFTLITDSGEVQTNAVNYQHSFLSQGCEAGSLYDTGNPNDPNDHGAFGTPNGASLPFLSAFYWANFYGANGLANFAGAHEAFGLGGSPYYAADPFPGNPAGCDPNGFPGFGGCFIPPHQGATPILEPRCEATAGRNGVSDSTRRILYPVNLCTPDVFRNQRQSHDLRTISSQLEPQYRATSDIVELSFDYDLSEALTFSWQSVYAKDDFYATQDYNRFTAFPIWEDSSLACNIAKVSATSHGAGMPNCSTVGTFAGGFYADLTPRPEGSPIGSPGVLCDPQLGCSDTLLIQDLSRAKSKQFNQEIRLVSSFDSNLNFSLGANYTSFETVNDYFVFSNAFTHLLNFFPFNDHSSVCIDGGVGQSTNPDNVGTFCRYVDPHSIDEIIAGQGGDGHNYFRNGNPYELTSTALFGELYWNATETVKVTAGLRMTWDQKRFTPLPSQLLLADYRESGVVPEGAGPASCGEPFVRCPLSGTAPGGRGYLAEADIIQEWREPTGRLVVDWSPDLAWTDETMFYGSMARGYKGGGANPPSVAEPQALFFQKASGGFAVPPTFEPEYINAFELGTKNTLMGGALVLNGGAFYYDYTDYQVSKIVDRTAVNENFDAEVWGLEFESTFAPTRDLRFNLAIGYLRTRVADGEGSIDLMDRADGGNRHFAADPDALGANGRTTSFPGGFDEWVVLGPDIKAASNCIVPRALLEANAASAPGNLTAGFFCPNGSIIGGKASAGGVAYFDENGVLMPVCNDTLNPACRPYDPAKDAPNGSQGFFKDLSGHELPNAPRFTVSAGAQYTMMLPGGWDATGRVDFYWQDKSFARIYNISDYDRLKAWTNTNLSIWVENAEWGVKAEAYVKNVFDETPITGAFLNSDDSGLTTNVFTLDPRLVGVSVTKEF